MDKEEFRRQVAAKSNIPHGNATEQVRSDVKETSSAYLPPPQEVLNMSDGDFKAWIDYGRPMPGTPEWLSFNSCGDRHLDA